MEFGALAYARMKNTVGIKTKGTERMQVVLTAIFKKVKDGGIFEAKDILAEILPKMSTNLKSSEILSLLPTLFGAEVKESESWPYETTIYDDGGYLCNVPTTLESNVIKLHKEILGQENYVPSEKLKEISGKITEKTTKVEGDENSAATENPENSEGE